MKKVGIFKTKIFFFLKILIKRAKLGSNQVKLRVFKIESKSNLSRFKSLFN